LLRDFWAQHACSPTRVATLTGRYAYRTGVYIPLGADWDALDITEHPQKANSDSKELDNHPGGYLPANEYITYLSASPGNPRPGPSLDEVMLPRALKNLDASYNTAAFGKWHMGTRSNGLENHPRLVGFDHFSGVPFGTSGSYFAWHHNENGNISNRYGYVDQRTTDDAAAWIHQQGDDPWFVWLSYVNPHTPIHKPPTELLSPETNKLDPQNFAIEDSRAYFFAQIEALDTLVGQLMQQIPAHVLENTYVIFFGDNGTVKWDRPPGPRDLEKYKGTAYEGGLNVPAIITGPGIAAGQEKTVLAHVVDLYATIIELAGGVTEEVVPADTRLDSVSLVDVLHTESRQSRREWVLAEQELGPSKHDAIRDHEFKLIIDRHSTAEEFYHLASDPLENKPLDLNSLNETEKTHYDRLKMQYAEFMNAK
jgi:arylsulfatase A-like enzyme